MVSKPQQFDVMLMPNLYGSIITNISAGLVGGAGLISGVNIGNNFAVFETVINYILKIIIYYKILYNYINREQEQLDMKLLVKI